MIGLMISIPPMTRTIMDTAKVSYSERDGLATLALNMPEKLNSLSTPVFEEL
jgi:enoyl-CoA hydratase/carnithine racemase